MPSLFESPSDLSEYLFRITDNGGSSADRYTVMFSDGSYLALSGAPTDPQGVSQSGDDIDPATVQAWIEDGEAVDLALGDLPQGLVQHILDRNNEGLADFLASVERKETHAVAPSREKAKANEGTHRDLGVGIYVAADGYRVRLDGHPDDDRGPFATAREAVLASLPDTCSLSGPEYQSTVDDLMRLEPSKEVKDAVEALEARREAEWARSQGL